MNEPQVWTLIGVFAASMVGIITLVLRIINTQFESLRGQTESLRNELKSDIASVRTELQSDISAVRTELQSDIATVRTQITHLDRDVQAISKRVFPE